MIKAYQLTAILVLSLLAASAAAAQGSHAFPFRATNYDVEVIVHPDDQTIQAQAKVDFVADQVAKTLLVELHPDLRVTSVKCADGQSSELWAR